MEQLASDALKLVADGKVKFVPENWTTTYNQWLNNIQRGIGIIVVIQKAIILILKTALMDGNKLNPRPQNIIKEV